MKIVPIPKKGVKCGKCSANIFQATSPSYSLYPEVLYACPLCDHISRTSKSEFHSDDKKYIYGYCDHCGIFYDLGCRHAIEGCDADLYYAKLITQFEHKGIKQNGMPVFNSRKEIEEISNIKMECMCCYYDIWEYCPHACYSDDEDERSMYIKG